MIRGWRTWEVNGAVVVGIDFVDHILQFGLGGVLAEGAHDCAEFFCGDLAIAIFILLFGWVCQH